MPNDKEMIYFINELLNKKIRSRGERFKNIGSDTSIGCKEAYLLPSRHFSLDLQKLRLTLME